MQQHYSGDVSVAAHMWEQHYMGLQQRDGDVPGIVSFAQELDQL